MLLLSRILIVLLAIGGLVGFRHAAGWTGLVLALAAALLVVGWLARRRTAARRRRAAARLLARHRQALMRRYRQLVRADDYGFEDLAKWHAELARFRIATDLDLDNEAAEAFDDLATRTVQNWIAAEADEHLAITFDSDDPLDYEHHCAELLRRAGWKAELTALSGDQGVDVVATRGPVVVAIQCKLYAQNAIGNKAVQEAHAAAGFVDATHAAVVSNRPYTRAAEELAAKLGVLLLHHGDLPNLDRILRATPQARTTGMTGEAISR